LADDHPGILRALWRTLDESCEIVGEVNSGGKVLEAVQRLAPQILVLDLSMPEASGLDLCPQVREARPETKIIVLTAFDDPDMRAEALRLGASALVLKNLLAVDLVRCIHQVVAGDPESVRTTET
jgi:two-component system, NarL family, response regulator DegU